MSFTKRALEVFRDACVLREDFYMAAVACIALGGDYATWKHLPLSNEQVTSVRSMDSVAAMKVVVDYAWEMAG